MPKSLTAKQEAFAVAYIRTLSPGDAYREAYSPKKMKANAINVEAHRLLNHPTVSLRIAQLRAPALAVTEMTIERTIREAAAVAYSDIGEVFDDANNLIPIKRLPRHVRAAISSVKFDKDTGRLSEIKLWDKNSGLEKAFKHLGLFEKDNTQKREDLNLQIVFVEGPSPKVIDG